MTRAHLCSGPSSQARPWRRCLTDFGARPWQPAADSRIAKFCSTQLVAAPPSLGWPTAWQAFSTRPFTFRRWQQFCSRWFQKSFTTPKRTSTTRMHGLPASSPTSTISWCSGSAWQEPLLFPPRSPPQHPPHQHARNLTTRAGQAHLRDPMVHLLSGLSQHTERLVTRLTLSCHWTLGTFRYRLCI
jgi:hypothetical protein